MLIEALKPIRVRFPEGERQLLPGHPYDLPDDQARKLVARAPGKVRIIHPGFTVTWKSPLFGICEGKVTEVKADAIILKNHCVTKERVKIPAAWITNIEGESV